MKELFVRHCIDAWSIFCSLKSKNSCMYSAFICVVGQSRQIHLVWNSTRCWLHTICMEDSARFSWPLLFLWRWLLHWWL